MSSPPDRAPLRSIAVLNDLHLAAGRSAPLSPDEPIEQFFHDRALASLVDQLASEPVDALLLLGDIFELPGGMAPGPVRGHYHEVLVDTLIERLDRIAAAHDEVFAALKRFEASGGTILVVPGNHDPGLHHPAVFDRLRWHLQSAGRPPRLELHHRAIHLPGFLYAEHGHAHHVLNTFRDIEHPWVAVPGDPGAVRLEDPIGIALHRARLSGDGSLPTRVRAGGSVLRSAAAHLWAIRRDRAVVPGAVDPALDQVGASTGFTLPRAFAAIVRLGVSRLDRRRPHYLSEAAQRIHQALDAHDGAVPIYVFGHSHRPELRRLPNGTWLLNAGSWAAWSETRSVRRAGLPYGRVRRDGTTATPQCELSWWPATDTP